MDHEREINTQAHLVVSEKNLCAERVKFLFYGRQKFLFMEQFRSF